MVGVEEVAVLPFWKRPFSICGIRVGQYGPRFFLLGALPLPPAVWKCLLS